MATYGFSGILSVNGSPIFPPGTVRLKDIKADRCDRACCAMLPTKFTLTFTFRRANVELFDQLFLRPLPLPRRVWREFIAELQQQAADGRRWRAFEDLGGSN